MGGPKTAAFCYLEASKYLNNYLSPQSPHAVNCTHIPEINETSWTMVKIIFGGQRFLLPLWKISSQGLLLFFFLIYTLSLYDKL